MWKLAAERRRSHCARNAHGLAGEVFQMGGKFPPNVQLALYKMSPDKQLHSCGVSTEAVKV